MDRTMTSAPFSDNEPQRIEVLMAPAAARTRALPHFEPPIDTSVAILLVDDVEDNRLLITLFLKGSTYRLDTAENGAVAVGKFQSGNYNLVLMDIQMPIMDGYEATRTIRAWEDKEGRDATPIIALTASALEDDIEKARAAGVTAHLTKPIKKQTLLDVVRHYAMPSPRKEEAL